MRNEQPRKLEITELKGGYNKVYITNSQPFDADILGRAFWVTKVGGSTNLVKVDALTNYATLTGLDPSSTYNIRGAFYDSMVDDSLLAAQALVELSDQYTVETQGGPVILSIVGEVIDVDIGVVLPNLVFTLDGQCDTLVIEYQEEGTGTWTVLYSGGMATKVSIPAPKVGRFLFRSKGVMYANDGSISEASPYAPYGSVIDANFKLANPTAPYNVTLAVGKINDSFERYDVKVSWNWDKGNGAGLKSFVVEYTNIADYNLNGFNNAKTISAGQSNSTIITNFPFGIENVIRVSAVSYAGVANKASSVPVNLTITSSTPLTSDFTKETLLDISYNGIFGYRVSGANRIATFAIDATNGNMGLGTPVGGVFPIQLNGATGVLSVDGAIITKSINAASFILTNFTGQDNPALYSEGKTYGSGVNGIWTGCDNVTGTYKFDLGNAAKYIRWDGENLDISGQVRINSPLGSINLEDTVARRTVWVYREASTQPPTPIGTNYPPPAWSTTPVAISNPANVVWASQGLLNTVTNQLEVNKSWSFPVQFSGSAGANGAPGAPGAPGASGDSVFKSTVFLRSNSRPGTPSGGSFDFPVPAGWSDGTPDGTTILWSSTRIFTKSGAAPQQAVWSTPAQLTDTSTQEIRYSEVAVNPGDPTNTPWNWSTTASIYTIWMAQRISLNGIWNAWEIAKIKGENGADGANGTNGINGSRGAGMYTIATVEGIWYDSVANSATPGGVPVNDDVVTIFKQSDTKVATTKRYYNGSWIAPGLTVHGDMIATGTIAGDRFVAGTEIVAPVIKGGTVQLIGSAYMKIQSSTPFGPDGLIEWYGPRILSGSNPDLTQVRKSNAITYLSANGDAYFGGSLSAGVLKNGVSNTLLTDYPINSAPVELGPFSTNGRPKVIVISYYMYAYNNNYVSNPGTITPPSLGWSLQKWNGSSWSTLTTGTFTGFAKSGYEAEDRSWWARWNITASTTFTDTSTSTANVSYRILISSYVNTSAVSKRSDQNLTLISTEQ